MITEKIIYVYRNFTDQLRETLHIPEDISIAEATRISDCGTLLWFFGGRYYQVPQATLENALAILGDVGKIENSVNNSSESYRFVLSDMQEIGPTILPLL